MAVQTGVLFLKSGFFLFIEDLSTKFEIVGYYVSHGSGRQRCCFELFVEAVTGV